MNPVNEAILGAISTVVDNAVAKLQFDKTIKCVIVNADKAQSGEYKVKYYGDTFTAYSEDTSKVYRVNDNVYVKVPENNYDNKKYITEKIGLNGANTDPSLDETEGINKVDLVGISWDKIYHYPLGICLNVEHNTDTAIIYNNTDASISQDLEFQRYSADRNYFVLKGTFTTNFTEIPVEGNYGLRVTFKYKTPTDPNELKYRTLTYYIDHFSMTGNSYNYTNSSEQYLLLSVEGKYLLGIEKIELFQEGIVLENGGSICVDDILLQFVEPIEDYSTYSVNILTKEGIYLNNTSHTSISLEAQYKYKGVNILSESNKSNYSIYWFREDKKVGRFSEDYNAVAGIGWKLVDKDKIVINIGKNDVLTSMRYMLIIQYNDYTIKKVITVYQENSNYKLEMRFSQDKDNLSVAHLEVLATPADNSYEYFWVKENIDGVIEEIENQNKNLDFDLTNIYLSNIFYCSVYKGNYLIGTVNKEVSTDIQENDLEVTFTGGNTTFLYDESGDITLATAEATRELGFNLAWKNGKVSQYNAEWTVPPEEETMLTDFLFNEDKTILYYKLRPKYSAERTNNTVSLLIKLNDGREFEVRKEFIFLKQGNPGTNGTTFTTKIESSAPYLISGAVPVNTTRLSVTAYKDGELASSIGYTVNTSWSIPSVYSKTTQIVVDSNTGQVTAIGDKFGNKSYYANIVKATTRIYKGTESTTIYNYYPVIILKYTNNRNFEIISRVKEILYSSDGYNSNYASTTPFKANVDGITWSVLGDTGATFSTTNEGTFLEAPKKYLASNGALAISADISGNYIICPIVVTLDTYGLDWVNSWDGLTVDVNSSNGSILAPMIGAGEKNSSNQFSGVVMGVHSLNNETNYKDLINGLVGYKNGEASFGFMSDGTGFIGLSNKGRISFDGDKGTITSGNYSATDGMQIDLTKGTISSHNFKLNTGTVKIDSVANSKFNNYAFRVDGQDGKSVFAVYHNGKMYCENADISGKITAHDGYIGGWTIEDGQLSGGYLSAGTIYGTNIESASLESSYISGGSIDIGSNFSVDSGGNMTCSNADVSGTINSSSGTIGGFTIGDDTLTSGDLVIGEGLIRVGGSRILLERGLTLVGPNGGGTVRLNNGNVYIESSGSSSLLIGDDGSSGEGVWMNAKATNIVARFG